MNGAFDTRIQYEKASDRYLDFFIRFARENQSAFAALEDELQNFINVLQTLNKQHSWASLTDFVGILDIFLDSKGYWELLGFWLGNAHKYRNEIPLTTAVVKNLLSYADLRSIQGNREEAVTHYQEALEKAQKLDNLELIARAYYGVGTIYFIQEKKEEALISWNKGLSVAKECEDDLQIATLQYFINQVDQSVDQEDNRNWTFNLFETLGKPVEVLRNMLMAFGDLRLGKFEDARISYQAILNLFQQEGERQGEALVLYYLGLIAQGLGDLPKATSLYLQSEQISLLLNDRTGLMTIYSTLGLAYLQSQQFVEARTVLEKAVLFEQESGCERKVADNLYWLGYAYANSGSIEQAKKVFITCKDLFTRLEPERVADVDELLSKIENLQDTNPE